MKLKTYIQELPQLFQHFVAEEAPNYLDMSDEDILKQQEPVAAATEEVEQPGSGDAGNADEGEENAETVKEGDEQTPPKPGAGDEDGAGTVTDEEVQSGEGESDPTKVEKPGEKPAKDDKTVDPTKKVEATKTDEAVVDYKAEYERLLAPFKANNREVKVDSVDDAITLMQMGANYNKKMAALKPNLALLKLLEKNDLLSEEKLSFLIELDKKSPDAINKLVKDSGLNPMDFDADKAGQYKPTLHRVDAKEIALDSVLDDIKDTDSYVKTLGIVTKQWDEASKQVIADHPVVLKTINDHVSSGIYDLIIAEVERDRMLGRLEGVSDIEAYRQAGDRIHARGGFNHLGSSQGKTTPEKQIVPPKPKTGEDEELKNKRRAMGSAKPASGSGAVNQEFNPLALSDEEFSKLSTNKFR